MNAKSLSFAVLAVAVSLALVACKKDEPPAPAPSTEVAPAPAPAPAPSPSVAATASVTQLQLGTPGADGRVGFESTNFAPTDTIVASVSTNTTDPTASVSGKLLAKWTYQDGQVVNEEEKYFTFIGPGVTNFQISKPDGWPSGNYTLSVALDGNVVQTREFVVR
ncbi:hypothetical protein [Arenimonas sp. MALMAid1274]|uniref:hypothetical protein n=1 Tax=Arenimonas sp. MALMAid1274 TaxID=3411630 RepID=UPI003BA2477D